MVTFFFFSHKGDILFSGGSPALPCHLSFGLIRGSTGFSLTWGVLILCSLTLFGSYAISFCRLDSRPLNPITFVVAALQALEENQVMGLYCFCHT